MTIQIPTKYQVLIRSLGTIAVGGAITAATPIMQSVFDSGDLSHIDWHKVFQTGCAGAAAALYYHFKQSITAPAVKPDDSAK